MLSLELFHSCRIAASAAFTHGLCDLAIDAVTDRLKCASILSRDGSELINLDSHLGHVALDLLLVPIEYAVGFLHIRVESVLQPVELLFLDGEFVLEGFELSSHFGDLRHQGIG